MEVKVKWKLEFFGKVKTSQVVGIGEYELDVRAVSRLSARYKSAG